MRLAHRECSSMLRACVYIAGLCEKNVKQLIGTAEDVGNHDPAVHAHLLAALAMEEDGLRAALQRELDSQDAAPLQRARLNRQLIEALIAETLEHIFRERICTKLEKICGKRMQCYFHFATQTNHTDIC